MVSSSISNFISCNKKQCSGKDVYTTCVCMYGERSHLINETFGFGREEGREGERGRRGSKLVCHKLFCMLAMVLSTHPPSLLPTRRTSLSWWPCAPVSSGLRGGMVLHSCTSCWRALDPSREYPPPPPLTPLHTHTHTHSSTPSHTPLPHTRHS